MKLYSIYARLFTGLMLIIVWGLADSPLLGVVFILVMTALSAAGYRVARGKRIILQFTEILVCACFAVFWLPALLGLWFPAIGLLRDKWEQWEIELLSKDYEDRGERLKLEEARENAALELQSAARLAKMNERARIAQDIHDHVGHEVTGALIALQTAAALYEKNDPRTGELLEQTIERLMSASENLRETVHNLKPSSAFGLSSLEDLCEAFTFCPLEMKAAGDLSGFDHWELLAANLKEALTNISRHSQASLVTVQLDGNKKNLRMTVADNGKTSSNPSFGLGLGGMRERVRLAGGTLSINTDRGFSIICVLPKGEV
jgi:signal transduction histidine kinase